MSRPEIARVVGAPSSRTVSVAVPAFSRTFTGSSTKRGAASTSLTVPVAVAAASGAPDGWLSVSVTVRSTVSTPSAATSTTTCLSVCPGAKTSVPKSPVEVS